MKEIEIDLNFYERVNCILNPFPHVIIDEFYNEYEFQMILKELDFLFVEGKLLPPGIHHAPAHSRGTTHQALRLESVYAMQEISNILHFSKKTTDKKLASLITLKIPSFKQLNVISKWATKVRYYFDGEGYLPHADLRHSFLTFWYHHKEPKKYTGGEVYFPEYGDYSIEPKNNRMVIVPSYATHGVHSVKIESEEDYWNGNGRFCISQFMRAEPLSEF